MELKEDVESRMRDVRARLALLNNTLDRVDTFFTTPHDTTVYRQGSVHYMNQQRSHASTASDDFLVRERAVNTSLNSTASTKKGVDRSTERISRPAPCPPTETEVFEAQKENLTAPRHYTPVNGGEGEAEYFDAYRAIQERLRRKVEALEHKRSGGNSSTLPLSSSCVETQEKSDLKKSMESEPSELCKECSPPPRAPTLVETTEAPSPDTPQRAASMNTAVPEELSPLSDRTLMEVAVTPCGQQEVVPPPARTEPAANEYVSYHSASPSVNEQEAKAPPAATLVEPRVPTDVHLPSAGQCPRFAKPTVSVKVRQQSGSVDRPGARPAGCAASAAPPLSSETLRNLHPQMPSATIAVTLTGAELFALLRLRGLVISFGETNEQLLKERECHAMFLTANEYEQLVELRCMVRSHSSSQARRSASSAPSEATEAKPVAKAVRHSTTRVATTRATQGKHRVTGPTTSKRISSVYRPSERPLFAPPPKSAVQPRPWMD